jgi:hypothetical protein
MSTHSINFDYLKTLRYVGRCRWKPGAARYESHEQNSLIIGERL